ncbi:LDLR chaperone boca [Diabrotica virgifera virgifera]|uniref:LDLR chaperone boca n=1 Tax=Diabrotica virgifera virgifera TaxID=50390 RepID=A0A6P7FDX3_DIAVI|nr:LDLR chaperone boca [Diabrotica virgifera virgifera]
MVKLVIFCVLLLGFHVMGKKSKDGEKPEWAKKDIRDYTEADMERLLDQWEEDEEPLEPDELPEHLRPMPQINLNQMDPNNPEDMLQATKKGRTLMTFIQVAGNPSRDETEELTKLWQTSLWNNHIQAERYLVDDNRAIFLFKDGSQAWVAKDYLLEQEKCESMTIESKVYPGKYSKNVDKQEL